MYGKPSIFGHEQIMPAVSQVNLELPLILLERIFPLIAYRLYSLGIIIEYRFSPALTTFAINVITSPSSGMHPIL